MGETIKRKIQVVSPDGKEIEELQLDMGLNDKLVFQFEDVAVYKMYVFDEKAREAFLEMVQKFMSETTTVLFVPPGVRLRVLHIEEGEVLLAEGEAASNALDS